MRVERFHEVDETQLTNSGQRFPGLQPYDDCRIRTPIGHHWHPEILRRLSHHLGYTVQPKNILTSSLECSWGDEAPSSEVAPRRVLVFDPEDPAICRELTRCFHSSASDMPT